MKIELHTLQNFPPSNLNRDDTGSPKDCTFGGVRRARISSQCRKRSIRTSDVFDQALEDHIAIRTKKCHEPLTKRLTQQHDLPEEQAGAFAQALAKEMLGWDDAKGVTKVLFYVGQDELDRLAQLVAERAEALGERWTALNDLTDGAPKKKQAAAEKAYSDAFKEIVTTFKKEAQDHVKAADIALFGRMLAEVPTMNIDAASQVAHSISTHKVDMDFDYFTAVDDLNPKEDTGAGMIGTTGFNSACFYSYALIDADQLAANLGGDRDLAAATIASFLEAALYAIPTGKQNSFAAQTPPSLFMAVVRDGKAQPWSLANAFADPVRPPRSNDDEGLVTKSVRALDTHWDSLCDMYGCKDTHAYVKVAKHVGGLSHLSENAVPNAQAVIERVSQHLSTWRAEGNA